MSIESLATVKANLSTFVDQVEHEHERVTVTRNGRPAAVLISVDELEALEETLDILSTPGALEEIKQAQADIDAGNYVTGEELAARYNLKR
jgi:prevent-host-death family protein